MPQFAVLLCFLLCISVLASLAQWLEDWSCKPVVKSSNLSRGWNYFYFCPDWCTNDILIYLFIHSRIGTFFLLVRSFINILARNSFYLFSQVVPFQFGHSTFWSVQSCSWRALHNTFVYFEDQCIGLVSSVVRALVLWTRGREFKSLTGLQFRFLFVPIDAQMIY